MGLTDPPKHNVADDATAPRMGEAPVSSTGPTTLSRVGLHDQGGTIIAEGAWAADEVTGARGGDTYLRVRVINKLTPTDFNLKDTVKRDRVKLVARLREVGIEAPDDKPTWDRIEAALLVIAIGRGRRGESLDLPDPHRRTAIVFDGEAAGYQPPVEGGARQAGLFIFAGKEGDRKVVLGGAIDVLRCETPVEKMRGAPQRITFKVTNPRRNHSRTLTLSTVEAGEPEMWDSLKALGLTFPAKQADCLRVFGLLARLGAEQEDTERVTHVGRYGWHHGPDDDRWRFVLADGDRAGVAGEAPLGLLGPTPEGLAAVPQRWGAPPPPEAFSTELVADALDAVLGLLGEDSAPMAGLLGACATVTLRPTVALAPERGGDSHPGLFEYQVEVFGRTQLGKTTALNAALRLFAGSGYVFNSPTQVTGGGARESTTKGDAIERSRLAFLPFADFDMSAGPGAKAWERQQERRIAELRATANLDGGGAISSKDGRAQRRAEPMGLLIRTGEHDPRAFTFSHSEEGADSRGVTWVLEPIDSEEARRRFDLSRRLFGELAPTLDALRWGFLRWMESNDEAEWDRDRAGWFAQAEAQVMESCAPFTRCQARDWQKFRRLVEGLYAFAAFLLDAGHAAPAKQLREAVVPHLIVDRAKDAEKLRETYSEIVGRSTAESTGSAARAIIRRALVERQAHVLGRHGASFAGPRDDLRPLNSAAPQQLPEGVTPSKFGLEETAEGLRGRGYPLWWIDPTDKDPTPRIAVVAADLHAIFRTSRDQLRLTVPHASVEQLADALIEAGVLLPESQKYRFRRVEVGTNSKGNAIRARRAVLDARAIFPDELDSEVEEEGNDDDADDDGQGTLPIDPTPDDGGASVVDDQVDEEALIEQLQEAFDAELVVDDREPVEVPAGMAAVGGGGTPAVPVPGSAARSNEEGAASAPAAIDFEPVKAKPVKAERSAAPTQQTAAGCRITGCEEDPQEALPYCAAHRRLLGAAAVKALKAEEAGSPRWVKALEAADATLELAGLVVDPLTPRRGGRPSGAITPAARPGRGGDDRLRGVGALGAEGLWVEGAESPIAVDLAAIGDASDLFALAEGHGVAVLSIHRSALDGLRLPAELAHLEPEELPPSHPFVSGVEYRGAPLGRASLSPSVSPDVGGLEIMFPSWQVNGPFADAEDAAELLAAHLTFRGAFVGKSYPSGYTFRHSSIKVGANLIRGPWRRGKRRFTAPSLEENPRLDPDLPHHAEVVLDWTRPRELAGDGELPWVHAYDVNGQRLSACSGTWCGVGDLVMVEGAGGFDPKVAGYHHVAAIGSPRADLPDLVQLDGWYSTPRLAMAIELGLAPVIDRSEVWADAVRYLDPFYEQMKAAREALLAAVAEGHRGADLALATFKRCYTEPLGALASTRERDRGSRWYRPDWKDAVIGQEVAREYRVLHQLRAAGVPVLAVYKDAIAIESAEADPLAAVAFLDKAFKVSDQLGKWKVVGTAATVDALPMLYGKGGRRDLFGSFKGVG